MSSSNFSNQLRFQTRAPKHIDMCSFFLSGFLNNLFFTKISQTACEIVIQIYNLELFWNLPF